MSEPTEDRAAVILRLQAIGIGLYDSVQNDPETAFEDEDLGAFEAALAAYEAEPGLIEDINKAHEEAESLEREAECAKRMIGQQRKRAEQAERRLSVLAGEVSAAQAQVQQIALKYNDARMAWATARQEATAWEERAASHEAAIALLRTDVERLLAALENVLLQSEGKVDLSTAGDEARRVLAETGCEDDRGMKGDQ